MPHTSLSLSPRQGPSIEGQLEFCTLLTELEGGREQCHLPSMTDRAHPAGWVVQVTIPAEPTLPVSPSARRYGPGLLGAPSFKYFNVAIAAAGKAIEATSKHLADAEDRETSVVRPLSLAEIAALGLKPGDVVPA